jgi:hypothetical protein
VEKYLRLEFNTWHKHIDTYALFILLNSKHKLKPCKNTFVEMKMIMFYMTSGFLFEDKYSYIWPIQQRLGRIINCNTMKEKRQKDALTTCNTWHKGNAIE